MNELEKLLATLQLEDAAKQQIRAAASADGKESIEKARMEERTKLQALIADKEKQLTEATAKTAQSAKELQDAQDKIKQLEKITKEAGDGKLPDISKVIDETVDKLTKLHEKTMAETKAEYEAKLRDLSGNVTKMEIDRYREKKIAEAGGEDALILGLVQGDTKEEIDNSIQVAKSEFERIAAKLKKGKGGSTDDNPPPKTPKTPNPKPNAAEGNSNEPNIRSMSATDYKAQREKILADMRQRFAR